MKLAVVGAGYVGLSVACMLARLWPVHLVDVVPEKVQRIEAGESPIEDAGLSQWLAERNLNLHPTLQARQAYADARFVVIAVPTSYDDATGRFDTSLVDMVVEQVLQANPQATLVVKSTIPVGYTDELQRVHPEGKFLFSPEFLREGHALEDNLHPSRVVVGIPSARLDDADAQADARRFCRLMADASLEESVPQFVMSAQEAESVKLFANTYLAMRVAFFNELDTFAMARGLDTRRVVEGVCSDARIGDFYNNPSFGYGGYCLPKDSKQLLANFADVPQDIMGAVVASNATRKQVVADDIMRLARAANGPGISTVGIYRLVMKKGADNFRSSAVADIVAMLRSAQVPLLVYEPLLDKDDYLGVPVTSDLSAFKRDCTVIVANRSDSALADVSDKVYTRDLFQRD